MIMNWLKRIGSGHKRPRQQPPPAAEPSASPGSGDTDWTADELRQLFRKSADFNMERYELGDADHIQTVYLLYCEGMSDAKTINEYIIPRIVHLINEDFSAELDKKLILTRIESKEDIVDQVFAGNLVMLFEQLGITYGLDIADPPHRTPDESNTETAIKGPKDAFVEELGHNVALVRKRLRSNSLCYEQLIIGKRSRSKVALLYVEDITNPSFVDEARTRLQKIDMDLLYSSSQLEEIIADSSLSLFPLLHYTTRPDFVVDCLIRGRFAIIVEGAPTAIIGPANLALLLKTPEDFYIPYYMGTFGLLFRFIGLLIALLLPGFWIALTAFNIEQLPYQFIATISISRFGLPMPAPLEGFLMIGLFELFREAGERLPKAVGQTIAVIGGIIVGDAAIRAGLVSTTFLVVIAISAVSGFTLVNQSLVGSVSLVRLFVMLLSSTLGMYGFILSILAIVLYLATLESFGIPYLAPIAPFSWNDVQMTFLRKPWITKNRRPSMLNTIDKTRKRENS
ncbi:MAG: spore germination protein [Paenibacillus sp.]|nr:spore germination protein [Paenibacillus sp.]